MTETPLFNDDDDRAFPNPADAPNPGDAPLADNRPATETGCAVFTTDLALSAVQDFALASVNAPFLNLGQDEGLAVYRNRVRTDGEEKLIMLLPDMAGPKMLSDADSPPLWPELRLALRAYGLAFAAANAADEKARLHGLTSFHRELDVADDLAMIYLARLEDLWESFIKPVADAPQCLAGIEW